MLLFFIIAGSSLEVDTLGVVGWIGVAYVVLRALSRVIGAGLGALVGGAPDTERPLFGIALMPQAGVAGWAWPSSPPRSVPNTARRS